jgi:hypothetical protein
MTLPARDGGVEPGPVKVLRVAGPGNNREETQMGHEPNVDVSCFDPEAERKGREQAGRVDDLVGWIAQDLADQDDHVLGVTDHYRRRARRIVNVIANWLKRQSERTP